MGNKVHKTGPGKVEKYFGFGVYDKIPTPLCDGAKGLWAGNSYQVSRMWKNVTCKKCLKKRNA